MGSCAALRRQVQRLKLKQADEPPDAFNLASTFVSLSAGAPVPEEEAAAFWEAWQEAQRAAEKRPTVEELVEAALQSTHQRLPCELRELRPDERLASCGGEQERAD
jgi:hypothetical protein